VRDTEDNERHAKKEGDDAGDFFHSKGRLPDMSGVERANFRVPYGSHHRARPSWSAYRRRSRPYR
jgi:hypothetical protein